MREFQYLTQLLAFSTSKDSDARSKIGKRSNENVSSSKKLLIRNLTSVMQLESTAKTEFESRGKTLIITLFGFVSRS